MVLKYPFYIRGIIFLISVLLYCGCTNSPSGTENEQVKPLKISSVDPRSGVVGDSVIINGSGFNVSASSNTVIFGGAKADLHGTTETQLLVKVPEGASSGRVNVKVGDQEAEGPEFEVITTGAVEVIIKTSGLDKDRDGYTVNIDLKKHLDSSIQDTLLFKNIVEGSHQLGLEDLDNACSISATNPRSISVESQDTAKVTIDVKCEEVILKNKIAYRHCEEACDGIYIMNNDGSNPVQLTSHPWDLDPVISPDGTKVAFVNDRRYPDSSELHKEIYIVDASGNPITNISRPPESSHDQLPSWSPDGKKLVFSQQSKNSSGLDIVSVNADGTGRQKITDDSLDDLWPLYTPDGSKIVFYSFNRFGDTQIFMMNSDGTNIRKLTDNDFFTLNLVISNDGSMLAFDVQGDPEQIYVMNIDGTEIRRLTNDLNNYAFPSWSPDDSQLIFYNLDTSDIYKINLDGTGLTNITNTPEIDEPHPYWSPVD